MIKFIFFSFLRASFGAFVGAWFFISIIDYELQIMTSTPKIANSMALDPEYGFLSVRWYFENRNTIALFGATIGSLIGLKLKFPNEHNLF